MMIAPRPTRPCTLRALGGVEPLKRNEALGAPSPASQASLEGAMPQEERQADGSHVGSARSAIGESVKAVQAALAMKAGLKRDGNDDDEDGGAGDNSAEMGGPAGGKTKGMGKSKAKAKAKAKSKAKAKTMAKSKATNVASKPSVAAGKPKRPAMPPLKKVPPIKYLTCTVYSSEKDRKWRAITSANKRYDVSFPWKGGKESLALCMAWCEKHTE